MPENKESPLNVEEVRGRKKILDAKFEELVIELKALRQRCPHTNTKTVRRGFYADDYWINEECSDCGTILKKL